MISKYRNESTKAVVQFFSFSASLLLVVAITMVLVMEVKSLQDFES